MDVHQKRSCLQQTSNCSSNCVSTAMCRAAAPLTSRSRMARNGSQQIANRTTIDDAIGEAYDRTARWLGLNMGRGRGSALEELARESDAHSIEFSTPMQQHKDCNFSYAGLKTQVKLAIESPSKLKSTVPPDLSSVDVVKLLLDADAAIVMLTSLGIQHCMKL